MIPKMTIEIRNLYTYEDGDTEVGTFSYPVNCPEHIKLKIREAMGEYNARMMKCGVKSITTTSHFLIDEQEINVKQIVSELKKG